MNKCLNILISEKSWLKCLFVHCWALTQRNPFSSPSTLGRPHLWLSWAYWDPGLLGSAVLLAHFLSAHNHTRYKFEVVGLASSSILFSFSFTVKCWQKTEAGRWWDGGWLGSWWILGQQCAAMGHVQHQRPCPTRSFQHGSRCCPWCSLRACIVKLKTNLLSVACRWLVSSNEIMSSGTIHLIRTWTWQNDFLDMFP